MLLQAYKRLRDLTQALHEALNSGEIDRIEALISQRQELIDQIGDEKPAPEVPEEEAEIRSLLEETARLNDQASAKAAALAEAVNSDIRRQRSWLQALKGYKARVAAEEWEGRFIDRRR